MRSKVYDTTLPDSLKAAQQWFASIISRPVDLHNQINQVSPSGAPMSEEAPLYICSSPTMRSHERIQVYNQQYWWRLLSVLHDNHPFLVRLFGFSEFNQTIGIPYLVKYCPNHWSLNRLGARLPQWVREEYHEPDRQLVLNAARIDCSYLRAFVARQLPQPHLPDGATSNDIEPMLEQRLRHQPHVFTFAFNRDFFRFREELIRQEDGDYWVSHDFPPLPKEKTYIVLYRTLSRKQIVWKQIPEAAYRYLSRFKSGCSVNQSLDWLETQEDALSQEVAKNLRTWLQEWIALGWLAQVQIKTET